MNTIARNIDDSVRIRLATTDDAAAICDIYAPYVLETAITFDLVPPTESEMRMKIAETLALRPFLVAERSGDTNELNPMNNILGYAYASAFRPREAYIYAIETSVYLRPEAKGYGIGRRLYTALEDILRLQNVYTANACISHIDPPDEYSPDTSRLFHERMGYTQCAHIPNCGRKFDRWYGIIWMQKELREILNQPKPFIALSQIPESTLTAVLNEA